MAASGWLVGDGDGAAEDGAAVPLGSPVEVDVVVTGSCVERLGDRSWVKRSVAMVKHELHGC